MALVPWPRGAAAPALPEQPLSLRRAVALQFLALREPVRLAWRKLRDSSGNFPEGPEGERVPVLVIPGMGVSDGSTSALRRYLCERGCDARGWGLGVHRAVVADNLVRMLDVLETFACEARQPVAVVGWSLGGVLARELARVRPDLVRHLFTLGAPITGGVRQTALTTLRCFECWNFSEAERQIEAANKFPIRVPLTAFWSRRDGIIAWQACVDLVTEGAENLECTSVHWSLGYDPDVLHAISERLVLRPEPERKSRLAEALAPEPLARPAR